MRKIRTSVFIATSIDGFIARKDGNLDWLDRANEKVSEGEDCGYKAFMAAVDVLVMGRKTFDKVLSFGSWPYGDKKVWVLSRGEVTIPEQIQSTVQFTNKQPTELLAELETQEVKHVYVDGGATIQSFLQCNLIDNVTITMAPVAIGTGIALFGDLRSDIVLNHKETNTFEGGYVQLSYALAYK